MREHPHFIFFFFNDTAPTEIYTLPLHDALPIFTHETQKHDDPGAGTSDSDRRTKLRPGGSVGFIVTAWKRNQDSVNLRSEEHTSELQSQSNLVCRLLLEKKQVTQGATLELDRAI